MAKNDIKRVLMDSSALLALIKGDPGAKRIVPLMEMIDRGEVQLVASVLTLAEVYKESSAKDEGERDRQNTKLRGIRTKLESREVLLLDVTTPIARRATEYRRAHRMQVPDAVHLATAVLNDCDWLVTLDDDFPQLDAIRVFRTELLDEAAQVPWEVHVQPDLFDDVHNTDNVVPLKPRASAQG